MTQSLADVFELATWAAPDASPEVNALIESVFMDKSREILQDLYKLAENLPEEFQDVSESVVNRAWLTFMTKYFYQLGLFMYPLEISDITRELVAQFRTWSGGHIAGGELSALDDRLFWEITPIWHAESFNAKLESPQCRLAKRAMHAGRLMLQRQFTH
jgi:hypothetical protein